MSRGCPPRSPAIACIGITYAPPTRRHKGKARSPEPGDQKLQSRVLSAKSDSSSVSPSVCLSVCQSLCLSVCLSLGCGVESTGGWMWPCLVPEIHVWAWYLDRFFVQWHVVCIIIMEAVVVVFRPQRVQQRRLDCQLLLDLWG